METPIPDRHGSFQKVSQQLMATLREGDAATVSRVTEDEPSLLHFLDTQGLRLNAPFGVKTNYRLRRLHDRGGSGPDSERVSEGCQSYLRGEEVEMVTDLWSLVRK